MKFATILILLLAGGLMAQTQRGRPEPLTREVLSEILQAHKLPGKDLVDYVTQIGITFPFSAAIEQELRKDAAYLDSAQLEALITAIKTSYRPEWNAYKRFMTLRAINPVEAYTSAQDYLNKFGNNQAPYAKDYAEDVRRFVQSYEEDIKRNSDPLELAKKNLAKENYSEAIRNFDLALKQNRKAWGAYSGLITAYEKLDQHQNAVAAYASMVLAEPDSLGPYNDACRAFGEARAWRDAIKACNDGLSKHKRSADDEQQAAVYDLLGWLYRSDNTIRNHMQEAIRAFETATDIVENNAEYLTNLGDAYNVVGKHKEALKECQKAQALRVDFARAYNCVGEAYKLWDMQGPGTTAARQAFQTAVALDPDNSRYQNNLGDAYRGAKQYERAIKPYKESIRLNPKALNARYDLARTYLDLCLIDEARQVHEELKNLKCDCATDLLDMIEKKKCSSTRIGRRLRASR